MVLLLQLLLPSKIGGDIIKYFGTDGIRGHIDKNINTQINRCKPFNQPENTEKVQLSVIDRKWKRIHLNRQQKRNNQKEQRYFFASEFKPCKSVSNHGAGENLNRRADYLQEQCSFQRR